MTIYDDVCERTVDNVCKRISLRLASEDEADDSYKTRREHLTYAFKHVKPSKHVEYAFCVWAGTRHESASEVIDEYCNRRDSELIQGFPYSIVDSKFWKIPDTLGVFVFREQFFVLIAELTGCNIHRRAPQILHDIYRGACSFDDFCALLTKEHSLNLSEEEKAKLFEKISADYPAAIQYYYCSAIADEALSTNYSEQQIIIDVEEVLVYGFNEIHGFTRQGNTSFLHLSEEEFTRAEKVGSKDHIDKMSVEFHENLIKIAENKKRLNDCKVRRENKHRPKKKKNRAQF